MPRGKFRRGNALKQRAEQRWIEGTTRPSLWAMARDYNTAHPDANCTAFSDDLLRALAMRRPPYLGVCRLRNMST